MEYSFVCPKCRGDIQLKGYLVFSVKTETGKRGLIGLSPKLGDYESYTPPSFDIKGGEKVTFYCPICHHKLTFWKEEDLVRVWMFDENGERFEIFFSQIMGEQVTFQIKGNFIRRFGDKNPRFNEYLKIMQNYQPFKNMKA